MKRSPCLILLLLALLAWNGCSRRPNGSPPLSTPEVTGSNSGADPRFTTVRVDIRTERLELFLRDDAGQAFKNFERLRLWLAARNQRLRFAMNAGMFHPDFSPVGLLVQDGQQISPLNLSDGAGNFFLRPNGVFFISDAGPGIIDSAEYPSLPQNVRLATQSGPLLLRNGALHPKINAGSTSRLIRNGVGVSGPTIFFVISEQPVSFYEMAVYFRDGLHCPDALYLDGVVSGLYSIELDRNDAKADLGPILGVIQ